MVFARRGDGRLGPLVPDVSAGKHAHAVLLSPDNRFAFVPYLGSDLVAQYRFDDRTGALRPNDPPVGRPPRRAPGPATSTFHSRRPRVYLVNELDATVMAFDYDPRRGTLLERASASTRSPDYAGRRWAADIHVHPSGRFLYVSNRAHDSLAVFRIEPGHRALDAGQQHARRRQDAAQLLPRPVGRFLLVANQDSGNLVTFAIDPDSGRLTPHRRARGRRVSHLCGHRRPRLIRFPARNHRRPGRAAREFVG